MSIGPLENAARAAGLYLAQAKGSEVERAHGEVGAQGRKVYHERKAEAAAGIGEPDGNDHETSDRDADGRRPWENGPKESGNLLDLDG